MNFFTAPFDTLFQDFVFKPAGGEVIFELPNGLHGYYLSNEAGTYIHKGPVDIVRHKQGPDNFLFAVVNGASCMDCHKAGLLNKDDQVRLFAETNRLFEADVLNKIKALYSDQKTFTSVLDADSARYTAALKAMGVDATNDPVKNVLVNYYEDLSLADVAAELGVNRSDLLGLLKIQPFATDWAVLRFPGGTISRQEFNPLFGLARESLKTNLSYLPPREGDFFVTTGCMEENKFFMNECVTRVGEGTRGNNAGSPGGGSSTPPTMPPPPAKEGVKKPKK